MRPATGGRWIVGILIIVPMILVQLIYVVLIVQTGVEQAQLHVREGYGFAEYWRRSGAAGLLVRAVLMLGLFCLFVAATLGGGKAASFSRARVIVGFLAFVGWLSLMVIETAYSYTV
jgi:hypothetical protein